MHHFPPLPDAGMPVSFVDPEGQAELAGFKVGQNVLRINGQSVKGYTLAQAGPLISTSTSAELEVDVRLVGKKGKIKLPPGIVDTPTNGYMDIAPTRAPRRSVGSLNKDAASLFSNHAHEPVVPGRPPSWNVKETDPFSVATLPTTDSTVLEHIDDNTGTLSRANGASLGLSINSAPSPQSGVPITGLDAGGQAELVGFKEGQMILAINGVDVRGFSLAQAGAVVTGSDVLDMMVDSPVIAKGTSGSSVQGNEDIYQNTTDGIYPLARAV